MTARSLKGAEIARPMLDNIRRMAADLRARHGRPPGLVMILVGEDPASTIYVRNKVRACDRVGFHSVNHGLTAQIGAHELIEYIQVCNRAEDIDGVLLQLPLPAHLDAGELIEYIDPEKDVDGFHPCNIGRLALRRPGLRPATPRGVMRMIASTGVQVRGLNATIVGASNHVGRPMGLELLLAGCTVTTVHKFTPEKDMIAHVRAADILISAVGKPGLIQGDWVKPGAVVVDVGITRDAAGKLHGDLDFAAAAERASWITPVPGGVGPMTVAALLDNTLLAAQKSLEAWGDG